VQRSYKYRAFPKRAQVGDSDRIRWLLRDLWNAALQQRKEAWSRQHKTLTRKDQESELVALRTECPEYAALHFHLLQDVITRLDRGYQQFFERLEVWRAKLVAWRSKGSDPKKKPPSPGPPRFKGKWRYRSFTFKDAAHRNGAAYNPESGRVRIHGMGEVRIFLHRPWEGDIKQIQYVTTAFGHHYVVFSCDNVPVHPLPPTGEDAGVDVGVGDLAATEEELFPNPRFLKKVEKRLANGQRRRKRKVIGSNRWRKAGMANARQHARVANARRDYQHKVARKIVEKYDRIAIEGDLNIVGMARGFLAKSVHDAAMAQFLQILVAKAESAGREIAKPTARGSSQECSGILPDGSRCKAIVPKTLRDRIHCCPECGTVKNRDQNSGGVLKHRAFGCRPGRGLRGGAVLGPPRSNKTGPPSS